MVVDAGDLGQPLDLTHAEAAAAQFGDRRGRQRLEHHLDFAQQVDGRAGGDRIDVGRLASSSPPGPAAVSSVGPGDSPRITCPTSRGRITVSASTWRSRPAASSRCTGRSAGVPGAASRVRPIGDPSTSRSSSSRWGRSMPSSSSPIRVGVQVGGLERHLPGMPGQSRGRLGGHPHGGVAPHQRPARRSSTAATSCFSAPRSPIEREQLGQRHGRGLGVQHQQRVEHRRAEEVEVVGRSLDRLPGLRPGGQRGDRPGRRLGQVRPQLQQSDEPIVGQLGQPGAQRDTRS